MLITGAFNTVDERYLIREAVASLALLLSAVGGALGFREADEAMVGVGRLPRKRIWKCLLLIRLCW